MFIWQIKDGNYAYHTKVLWYSNLDNSLRRSNNETFHCNTVTACRASEHLVSALEEIATSLIIISTPYPILAIQKSHWVILCSTIGILQAYYIAHTHILPHMLPALSGGSERACTIFNLAVEKDNDTKPNKEFNNLDSSISLSTRLMLKYLPIHLLHA